MSPVMKDFRYMIFLILVGLLVCGCSAMSSLQTARVTKKEKVGFAFGIGGFFNQKNGEGSLVSNYNFFEVNLRYGIHRKWDIGVELGLPALLFFDTKYQFAGDDSSKLACSVGLGIGLNPWNENLFDGFGILLPLYTSYHPSPEVAFYISPRLFSSIVKESKPGYLAGASAGIRLGRSGALVLEYSGYTNFKNDNEYISQVMAAFSLNIP